MRIYYGIMNNSIDVTNICIEKLKHNNTIIIQNGDLFRASIFTDPLVGVHKNIIIENNEVFTEYDEYMQIRINVLNNTIVTIHDNDIIRKLIYIHSTLQIKHGYLNDEIPEQKMVVRYLTGNEKVLEIGGNIGRNSLIIASIVKNNLVTLECNSDISKQLIENRDLNNFNFYIECSALSNRKLIQKEWDTIPSETLLDGYNWINTITWENLKNKYNIEFDTLVLDCEGAFYYILMDIPEILDNINLIIMENDYRDITHKQYIDSVLKNNFYLDYVEQGGWEPCYNNFFEVWKRASKTEIIYL
jgi:FkbM family methyltransferase